MAETLDTTTKKYPHKPEDVSYEKEIVDAIKKLPLEQRFQAIALNNYILSRKQLDAEAEHQMNDIVRKFNKLQFPVMVELNNIISGQRAPTEEEIQDSKAHLAPEEAEKINENLTSEPISEYWFKVLNNCVRLAEDIQPEDYELLKKITSVEFIPEDATEDFTVKFTFAPNDYFTNEFLSVKFFMINENEPARTEATEIQWKEGKNITKKTVEKKQKNKKTGKTRTITKEVDAESFFNFFKSITPKDEPEGEDDEDEEAEFESERLDINYNIAATIQEEIVSYHLEYYLGLRHGDEDEDDLEGIDEEDEEDEDDDDEEDDRKGRGRGRKNSNPKKGGAAAGGDAGQKQECKQQ
jgi:nucleosome assembly protein 1-like 1